MVVREVCKQDAENVSLWTKVRENMCDLKFEISFQIQQQKHISWKKKLDKLGFIKSKIFYPAKNF